MHDLAHALMLLGALGILLGVYRQDRDSNASPHSRLWSLVLTLAGFLVFFFGNALRSVYTAP